MSLLDIDEKFEGVTREYLLKKGFREKYWGRSLYHWGDIYYVADVYSCIEGGDIDGDDWVWQWGQLMYFPNDFKGETNDPNWVPNKLVILNGGFREVCNINIKDTIDLDAVINQLNKLTNTKDDRKLYIDK